MNSMTPTERLERIEELESLIQRLSEDLAIQERDLNDFEVDIDDCEGSYREMLREAYGDRDGDINICGLTYDAAQALKAIDPTAYRCGLSDYAADIDVTETEELKALVSDRADNQNELDDLEYEFAQLEEEQDDEE